MSGYVFRGFEVREELISSLRRYIDEGIPPGGFLTAVICNDLSESVARADDDSLKSLPAIVGYMYNEAPGPCWGSRDRMAQWIAKHLVRRTAETTR